MAEHRPQPFETLATPVDLGAWESTYREHASRLTAMATFLVGRDAAPDLVTETMVRAVHSPLWSRVDSPGAYLTRVLVNEARRFRDREFRRVDREQRVFRSETTTSPTSRAANAADGVDADVLAAVRGLSAQQRAVVYLAYWEDLAIPEIAIRLEVSEGTVRRQLARAKDNLRKVL